LPHSSPFLQPTIEDPLRVDPTTHNKRVSFVWGIADDVLRDVQVRGKYRDAILPMVVIRRLDVILESIDEEVRKTKKPLSTNRTT